MKRPPLITFAALLLLTGVAAGAFGAHGLKHVVTPDRLDTWNTGVLYQLIHAMGIIVITQLNETLKSRLLPPASALMLFGTLIFSGSIYMIVLTDCAGLGVITPIGGVLFLIAWATVAVATWRGVNP